MLGVELKIIFNAEQECKYKPLTKIHCTYSAYHIVQICTSLYLGQLYQSHVMLCADLRVNL